MTALQKQFKLLSLALMLVGLVGVVAGALTILGPGASGVFFVGLGAEAPTQAFGMVGIVAVAAGICCVAGGFVSALAANRPRDVRRARVWSVVALLASLVAVALAAAGAALAWVPLLTAVLGACVFVWAGRANQEALDR